MMDSTGITLLLTGFLAGVGVMAAFSWMRGRKPKPTIKPGKSTDPLTADFRTTEAERQKVLTEYPLTYFIAASVVLIGLGVMLGAVMFGQSTDHTIDYFANVYLTILSTAFTVIVIDRLNRRREDQRVQRELKTQLLRDVNSTSNEIAKNAIHQLRMHGWLHGENGLLKGWMLEGTNLSGADLRHANLSGTQLGLANLSLVRLDRANARNANFMQANLNAAKVIQVDLTSTNLKYVNLRDAYLFGSNLIDASLMQANLSNAHIDNIVFSETTTLPDGTKWTPDTDLTRFTNPQHPNFWRSDDPDSPAYRGNDTLPAGK